MRMRGVQWQVLLAGMLHKGIQTNNQIREWRAIIMGSDQFLMEEKKAQSNRRMLKCELCHANLSSDFILLKCSSDFQISKIHPNIELCQQFKRDRSVSALNQTTMPKNHWKRHCIFGLRGKSTVLLSNMALSSRLSLQACITSECCGELVLATVLFCQSIPACENLTPQLCSLFAMQLPCGSFSNFIFFLSFAL